MKKLCSLLLALCMLLSGVTAFGAAEDVLSAIGTMNSYEMTYEMSFTLNRPIEVLAELDVPGLTDVVDLKALAESVFQATSKATVVCAASQDFKQIKVSMVEESNLPLTINDHLTNTTWSKTGIWLELDLSNSEKPVYRLIAQYPFYRKYVVMDLSKQLTEVMPQITAMYDVLLQPDSIAALQKLAVDAIQTHGELKQMGTTLSIRMDDQGFKNFLTDYIGGAMEQMLPVIQTASGASESEMEEVQAVLNEIGQGWLDCKDNITLLGKDGLSITYKTDLFGNLKEDVTTAHISLNLYQLCTALGATDEDIAPIAPDNSILDFHMNYTASYSNVNGDVAVTFPEITEENSFDPMAEYGQQPNYYPESNYEPYVPPEIHMYVEHDGMPVVEDGQYYLPLRPLMGEYGVRYEDIHWNDSGVIEIYNEDETGGFTNLVVGVNSTLVNKDGMMFNLDAPVIERDGTAYVPMELTTEVLQTEVMSAHTYMGSAYGLDSLPSSTFLFVRPNPLHISSLQE